MAIISTVKSALASWLLLNIPNIYVFTDDVVNESKIYPAVEISEISEINNPLGCGKYHATVYDDVTGYAIQQDRIIIKTKDFRLHVKAIPEIGEYAQNTVDGIVNGIQDEIENLYFNNNAPFIFVDTISTPNVTYYIQAVGYRSRQHLPPITNQKPFVWQGSLTVRLTYWKHYERAVDAAIEGIETPTGDIID